MNTKLVKRSKGGSVMIHLIIIGMHLSTCLLLHIYGCDDNLCVICKFFYAHTHTTYSATTRVGWGFKYRFLNVVIEMVTTPAAKISLYLNSQDSVTMIVTLPASPGGIQAVGVR